MKHGIKSARSMMFSMLMLAFALRIFAQQPAKAKPEQLIIDKQGSFFVGGRDIHSETLSTQPNFPPVGTITVDQMYVRYQIPADAKAHPITNLKPYTGMPILVVFGDYVDLSARWAPRLKLCREFVQAANKAGGKVELVMLPEIGFRGSSHMFMQDRNSLEIGDWLLGWIDSHIDHAP
jgi:hypothetical protein